MKFALLVLVVCALSSLALADQQQQKEKGKELPPGYASASDLAQVLANEPSAAESRFAQAASTADVITFRDGDNSLSTSSSSSGAVDEDDAEYDAQIAQVEQDIRKLKEAIKETMECARRLTQQESELRGLQEQKDHLQKEKERHQLQVKLDRQMRDLAEINRMSRALRNKFTELKRTQQLIRTKLTGTRTSLNQLDSEPDLNMDDIAKAPENIANEVDAMHAAQQAMLAKSHQINAQEVKTAVENANKAKEAAVNQRIFA